MNISTDAARAFPDQVFYETSKAALEAVAKAAAIMEMAGYRRPAFGNPVSIGAKALGYRPLPMLAVAIRNG